QEGVLQGGAARDGAEILRHLLEKEVRPRRGRHTARQTQEDSNGESRSEHIDHPCGQSAMSRHPPGRTSPGAIEGAVPRASLRSKPMWILLRTGLTVNGVRAAR